MATREYLVKLKTSEANRLGKWGSLWLDLLHVDMVLATRLDMPDKLSTAFTRRALWESAVVSYGRIEASTKKRKLTHEELLRAAGGEKALVFHAEIMRWRNEHIAHRSGREFEDIAVLAHYADDHATQPNTLGLVVSTWAGPKDDSPLAVEFREHVKRLRDTLWRDYLGRIGEAIARRERTESLRDAELARDDSDRLVVNFTLWSRTNGTGL